MATSNRSPEEVDPNEYNSHLFTIRLWQEAISQTEAEWRGRLQHVPSGQVYYFRTWSTLIRDLVSMLPDGGSTGLLEEATRTIAEQTQTDQSEGTRPDLEASDSANGSS